jgi:secondary thiamine-phosphate synthase enzyme
MMRSIVHRIEIQTKHETELINITPRVLELVKESEIQNGTVFVLSLHTTTGITVNEGLPDLETDITNMLHGLVPDEQGYHHARFLPSDGQMAVNATSHLRGALLGFQVYFPLQNGQMVTGSRQTIYLVELDGPQYRTFVVQIFGD